MKQMKKLFGIFAMAGIFIGAAFTTGCSDDSDDYLASGDLEYTLAEETLLRDGEDVIIQVYEEDFMVTVYKQINDGAIGVDYTDPFFIEENDSIEDPHDDPFYFLHPGYTSEYQVNPYISEDVRANFIVRVYQSGRRECTSIDTNIQNNGFRVTSVVYISDHKYEIKASNSTSEIYVGWHV